MFEIVLFFSRFFFRGRSFVFSYTEATIKGAAEVMRLLWSHYSVSELKINSVYGNIKHFRDFPSLETALPGSAEVRMVLKVVILVSARNQFRRCTNQVSNPFGGNSAWRSRAAAETKQKNFPCQLALR